MEACLGSWWPAHDLRLPRAKVWGKSQKCTHTRPSWLLELSSLVGETDAVSHGSQFWKHHLSAFYVYNSIPSWIVIKTWSWDVLPLLGYEVEEHQLFATNPLNSLGKFHGQFLVFETVVTSAKVFMCREWKAVTSYEQSSLLGNGSWFIWGMALGSSLYYNQLSIELGSFWIKTRGIGIITNKQFRTLPNILLKPPQNQYSHAMIISEVFMMWHLKDKKISCLWEVLATGDNETSWLSDSHCAELYWPAVSSRLKWVYFWNGDCTRWPRKTQAKLMLLITLSRVCWDPAQPLRKGLWGLIASLWGAFSYNILSIRVST